MRLPVIKSAVEFIEKNDEDYILETLEVLEHLAGAKGIKDEELEVIGELLSNLSGALEVQKLIKQGTPPKDALNSFMQRVLGSIGKN
jgi:hypothetical protein